MLKSPTSPKEINLVLKRHCITWICVKLAALIVWWVTGRHIGWTFLIVAPFVTWNWHFSPWTDLYRLEGKTSLAIPLKTDSLSLRIKVITWIKHRRHWTVLAVHAKVRRKYHPFFIVWSVFVYMCLRKRKKSKGLPTLKWKNGPHSTLYLILISTWVGQSSLQSLSFTHAAMQSTGLLIRNTLGSQTQPWERTVEQVDSDSLVHFFLTLNTTNSLCCLPTGWEKSSIR